MVRDLLHALSGDLLDLLVSQWLDVRSLGTLDVAVSSNISRPYWIMLLRSFRSASIDGMDHSASSLAWLLSRRICTSRVQMKVDAWRVPGCDLSLLKTVNLFHLGLNGCKSVTDECLVKAVTRCVKSRTEYPRRCKRTANAGVSASGAGCGQLQSIDLGGCCLVTDVGVLALGAGCGQLQSIDLAYCRMVTDVGVSALGAGYVKLLTFFSSNCDQVTDVGISALGAGCGQLQSIDLGGCSLVTDVGVSALVAGCGQLQSIHLAYCRLVTDVGVSALGAGCGQLQSIDLRDCSLVTDVGVLALVSCRGSVLLGGL